MITAGLSFSISTHPPIPTPARSSSAESVPDQPASARLYSLGGGGHWEAALSDLAVKVHGAPVDFTAAMLAVVHSMGDGWQMNPKANTPADVACWVQCLYYAQLAMARVQHLRLADAASDGTLTAQQLLDLVCLPASRHADANVR